MSGRMYAGDPHVGNTPASQLTFDVTAEVDEDLPEIEKNAALAAAVLGQRPKDLQSSRAVEAGEATPAGGSPVLDELGLAPGGVLGRLCDRHDPRADQGLAVGELGAPAVAMGCRHKRQFLFIGLPEEREAVEEVRRMMGDAADHTRTLDERRRGARPIDRPDRPFEAGMPATTPARCTWRRPRASRCWR